MMKLENSAKQVEITEPTQCPYCIDDVCTHPYFKKREPWVLKCPAKSLVFYHRKSSINPLFPVDCPLDDDVLSAYSKYCELYCPHKGVCPDGASDNCNLFQFIEVWYGAHKMVRMVKE